ncbi:hypothetical protein Tco_1102678 [Tanacetum coccineum]
MISKLYCQTSDECNVSGSVGLIIESTFYADDVLVMARENSGWRYFEVERRSTRKKKDESGDEVRENSRAIVSCLVISKCLYNALHRSLNVLSGAFPD